MFILLFPNLAKPRAGRKCPRDRAREPSPAPAVQDGQTRRSGVPSTEGGTRARCAAALGSLARAEGLSDLEHGWGRAAGDPFAVRKADPQLKLELGRAGPELT